MCDVRGYDYCIGLRPLGRNVSQRGMGKLWKKEKGFLKRGCVLGEGLVEVVVLCRNYNELGSSPPSVRIVDRLMLSKKKKVGEDVVFVWCEFLTLPNYRFGQTIVFDWQIFSN